MVETHRNIHLNKEKPNLSAIYNLIQWGRIRKTKQNKTRWSEAADASVNTRYISHRVSESMAADG